MKRIWCLIALACVMSIPANADKKVMFHGTLYDLETFDWTTNLDSWVPNCDYIIFSARDVSSLLLNGEINIDNKRYTSRVGEGGDELFIVTNHYAFGQLRLMDSNGLSVGVFEESLFAVKNTTADVDYIRDVFILGSHSDAVSYYSGLHSEALTERIWGVMAENTKQFEYFPNILSVLKLQAASSLAYSKLHDRIMPYYSFKAFE